MGTVTLRYLNQTEEKYDDESGNFWIGIAAAAVSVFFFGSMFVPVKRYKCGDGVFIQFIMAIGIFFVGFVIFAWRGFPNIYPIAMLGGLFWGVANSAAIPLINVLGIAIAPLIWNTTSCIMGWAVSRFGLFGVRKAPPKSDALNYAGLVLLIISGFMFMFVKKSPPPSEAKQPNYCQKIQIANEEAKEKQYEDTAKAQNMSKLGKHNERTVRHAAVFVSLLCGLLYGNRTTPVIYIQENTEKFNGAPRSGLTYVFSHFIGILLTNSSIFLLYSVYKRNEPVISPQLALPSFLCGISWAIAMSLLFVSNENLSQTIAFPIITVLPGCVAAIWSALYFKEIRGRRSIVITLFALVTAFLGSALVALSKAVHL